MNNAHLRDSGHFPYDILSPWSVIYGRTMPHDADSKEYVRKRESRGLHLVISKEDHSLVSKQWTILTSLKTNT